jgi:AcrR family transcriptional regulator
MPRSATPRRPQRRAADTRERIVAAALDAFADHGFDGATTRDIAGAAGVPQGLIAYHFAGKEALWRAAMDHIFGLLRSSLDAHVAALSDVDAPTHPRELLRNFVRVAAAHPELHRLMIQEGKRDAARTRWLVKTHVRPLYAFTSTLLRALPREGLAPRLPLVSLYYVLLGAACHIFVVAPECRQLTGVDPHTPAVIEAHADAIVTLLLGPGRSAEPRRRRSARLTKLVG